MVHESAPENSQSIFQYFGVKNVTSLSMLFCVIKEKHPSPTLFYSFFSQNYVFRHEKKNETILI